MSAQARQAGRRDSKLVVSTLLREKINPLR
jgi:hypothetical protein